MFKYIKSNYLKTFDEKTIPSLDGIRAISCLFVIFGHFAYLYTPFLIENLGYEIGRTAALVIGNQFTGVTFFFVLSGFLITNLLILEFEKSNTISIKNFFLKRIFRIFPAYYFYFIILILINFIFLKLNYSFKDIIAAVFYLYNYCSDLNPWILGHFWSLSVEEQFYLVWPLIFLLTYQKTGPKIPLIVIGISPLIRIMTYYLVPEMRGRLSILTHTRFDALMFGCLLAYYYRRNFFSHFIKYIKKYKFHYLSILFIFFISRFLQVKYEGKYQMTIGYSLECFFMCIFIIYTIEEKNIFSKILNWKILSHIGTLSYSLYLWHMPFVIPSFGSTNFIIKLILIYICALISYLIIEIPFLNLRKNFVS